MIRIGRYFICNRWDNVYPNYRKHIFTISPDSGTEIYLIKAASDAWIISFPGTIPLLMESYNRMFKSGRAFHSSDEAKQRVDLFLDKLSKLKAFL